MDKDDHILKYTYSSCLSIYVYGGNVLNDIGNQVLQVQYHQDC